jgi:hypothetical protein
VKYFTEAWASGELDEKAFDEVLANYREQLGRLDPKGAIWSFANSASLNDGYLDRVAFNRSTGQLNLLLLTGDLQVGYWRTELSYTRARIGRGENVLRHALSARPSEIWYDEFVVDPHQLHHGFLLAPKGASFASPGEFCIEFDKFDFARSPTEGRELSTIDDQSEWR